MVYSAVRERAAGAGGPPQRGDGRDPRGRRGRRPPLRARGPAGDDRPLARTPSASSATPTSRATTPSSAAPLAATGRSPTSARPTAIKVNGRRVSSTRLGPGDEVTLGTTTFLFDVEQ